MPEIESEQNSKPKHDQRRKNAEFRMKQYKLDRKDFSHDNHDGYYQMNQPLMLKYTYPLAMYTLKLFRNSAALDRIHNTRFVFTAVSFHIYSKHAVFHLILTSLSR